MSEHKIIFVDDEPNVTSGLRRMMHRYQSDWDMSFCTSGAEALELMAEQPYSVIITDMRMPEMTGADLLQQVHERHPETIRIVLSGHCNQDLILKSIGFAHQYLAKPCSAEDVYRAITRSLKLRSMLDVPELHARISQIRALPTPSDTYQKLVAAVNEEEPSLKKVGELIGEDVGLTTKLLQIINSAFFCLPTEVRDTHHAVNLLGLENIQSLVIATGVFNGLDVKPVGGISPTSMRNHGIEVGQLAAKIAKHWGLDQRACEHANLAGMLHDVGKLIQIAYFTDEMQEIAASLEAGEQQALAAEIRVLGVHHGQIGAHLLSLWGLPDPIIEAVTFHHDPSALGDVAPSVLTAVHVANALVETGSPGCDVDEEHLEALGVRDTLEKIRGLVLTEAY